MRSVCSPNGLLALALALADQNGDRRPSGQPRPSNSGGGRPASPEQDARRAA